MSNILLRRFGQGMAEIEGREEEQRRRAALSPAPQPEMVPAPEKEVDILGERFAQGLEQIKQSETPGYLGTFGKGFKSELTMGYGVSDEPPQIEGVGKKIAYGAGALAGMIPSFIALSTVTTPLGSAALKLGSIGRLVNTLHKVGKVYKIADKAGKARNVSKLGMAVEGAAKSGALFAAHGAAHELPPGEEGALARVKAGAEAVPMGMAFGAAAPLAGGRRLAQIGTAAGIGAGATAISGGTTEDILIQGGLLGAMSALHISVKDAHSFAKQIAGEVDKLPAEQKGAKIAEILDATREDRLDFARAKAEVAPSETDLIREGRLSFAQERAKDQPMGVPGDLPAPEKGRLPEKGVVIGEEPRPVPELLTAEGRPVSEAAEHERIVGALDTEGALRDAIQAVKIRDLKRQEGLIEAPGEARRPTGPVAGVRGAFGMRARPEPLVEPAGVPGERFVEARETPEQIEARRLEVETLLEREMLKELKENPAQIKDILENPRAWSEQWIAAAERLEAEGRAEPERKVTPEEKPEVEGVEIPEFTATEDALAFGRTATPQQTELMKTKRDEVLAKIEEMRAGDEMPDMAELMRASYLREAIQSSEGKIVEPGFKPKAEEPAVEVSPIKEEIPAEPVKPEIIEIPELKNTEDALAFGKTATPEQIEVLKAKQNESLAKSDALKEKGDLRGAMDEAFRGQFFKEAIDSAEGKVAVTPPAPPKPIEPVVEARAAEVAGVKPREVIEKAKPEAIPRGEKIAEPDKVKGSDPGGLRQKIYGMLNTELADLQAKGISKGMSIRITQANAIESLKLDSITLRYPGVVKRALGYLPELSAETQRMELISKYIKEGISRKEAGEKADAEMAVSKEPLSETKSRLLKNIKSEKGSSELINDLSRLGADAIKRGHKSFKAFAIEMKAVLGDAWAKVKHLMQRAYAGSKKILVSEKGAWTIKGKKAKAKEPVTWTMEEVEKRYADVLKGKPKKLRTGVLSTNQEKVSEDAKKFSVAIGVDYVKTRESEIEWERSANRIIKNRLELLETIKKASKGKEKLSPAEERVILKLNDGAYENFTSILKKGNLENINEKVKAFQDGLFKTEQDMGSDAGRNLRAFRRVKDIGVDVSRAFAGLEREIRKQDVDMYNTAVEASKTGNYKPLASFMKYLEKTKADPELMDYVYEYWYNCILSGVPTHVVNVASNTAWAAWQVGVHRPLLAAIDPIVAKFQKRPTEYYLDEIVPMLAGIRKGYKPGAEAAKEIMTKGYTTEASMDKWALDMGKTIGAFARSPNKHLRQIAPFLTIPTKALRAMDVWANQMGYQAELGAICKRMEKQGKGKFEDLMQSPTEEMQKEAAEYAAYTTFMNEPGKLTKWLEKGRDIVPGGRFVMPFVRTIANLTKRGVEMTPGLGIVLGRKATGREVTQVAVKQIEGAMIALALASMVADDRITGNVPADKAEREAFYRQGKLPWAIKIGGRWRQFRRLEPFNGPIAAVAIAHDAWKKTGEVPSTELAFRCTMGIVDNILDSSYLSGLTQVLDSVRRSDTAPQKIANMFDRTVASFSPMSSFQRSFVRAFEAMEGEGAIVRKPKGVAETIKAITPIISREVAAKKNIWGKEVVIPGSPLEQWLPWKAARPTKDVVELEIERLHGKTGLPYPGMPAKYMTVRGERIDLTDKQYDHLLVEGGQAAKKRLDRLVGTGYWKTMSDKEKTARIKRILSDSRKVARSKLKRELGGAVTIPGTGPRYKPKGFVPAAFTGRAFTPAKFEHAGF